MNLLKVTYPILKLSLSCNNCNFIYCILSYHNECIILVRINKNNQFEDKLKEKVLFHSSINLKFLKDHN